MTVPSDAAQPPRITYTEDGITLVRAVPFTFEDPTDLVVTRIAASGTQTPLALGADYAVSGGLGLVGNLTLTAAGTAGDTLRIDRDTPHDQLSDYEDGDNFPASRVEGDFDKLTRILQELARDLLHTRDIQQIIAGMLHAGGGILLTLDAAGDSLTITSTVDVFGVMSAAISAGAGIHVTVDPLLQKITISADGIDNLPDCVMLSGDQQTFSGAGSGVGGGLTTADVIADVVALIRAGTGVSTTYDPVAQTLTIANTETAYTDELARTAIGTALHAGALISIVVDDVAHTITISSSALDPSYRGLAVNTEAGSFDFVDAHGGQSIIYTGGAASATLQPDATHTLSNGWGTVLRHKGTAPLTLAIGAGVSVMVNGATSLATTISLAIGAVATLNRWGANDFTLVGPGITWS